MSIFLKRRELSVQIGDSLVLLSDTAANEYPLPNGQTFEDEIAFILNSIVALEERTRIKWKKDLLNLVGIEVSAAQDAFLRERNEKKARRLLADAEMHFRQCERGDEPKTSFLAGPDGQITKTDAE